MSAYYIARLHRIHRTSSSRNVLTVSWLALQVLALAAAVEATTRHPIADAVVSAADRAGLQATYAASTNVTVPGCGVAAMIDGTK
eukprot:scaffold434227_cov46-Prasinocladus_malaysianus.AAC.1